MLTVERLRELLIGYFGSAASAHAAYCVAAVRAHGVFARPA